MEKIFIAIIEFGRTKITGVLASKDNNSSEVAIIGIEEELSENLIEHGVLKGSTSDISFKVKRIIEKLEGRLSQRDNTLHINKVYVCVNDYTLSELNSSDAQAIASSTYIKKTSCEKIKKVFETINMPIVSIEPSPIATASCVPTEAKDKNCMVVDLGADTTSVCVYQQKMLKSVVTIPFGGENITIDIQNFYNLKHDDAEKIKIERSNAIPDDVPELEDYYIQNRNNENAPIPAKELAKVTEARINEIWNNFVWKEVENLHLEEQLDGGIYITGNASLLNGFEKYIQKQAKSDVRRIELINFPKASIKGVAQQANISCVRKDETTTANEAPREPERKAKEKKGTQFQKLLGTFGTIFDTDE